MLYLGKVYEKCLCSSIVVLSRFFKGFQSFSKSSGICQADQDRSWGINRTKCGRVLRVAAVSRDETTLTIHSFSTPQKGEGRGSL